MEVEKEKVCCFTGHRRFPWGYDEQDSRCLSFKQRLSLAIQDAYHRGSRRFISGMALGGDTYFAEIVIELRQSFSDLTLEAAIPCATQSHFWPSKDISRYQNIIRQCDFSAVLQNHYTPNCMLRRDLYMVEKSSRLIAGYDGVSSGGTQYTVIQGYRHNLDIILVPPLEENERLDF